MGSITEALQLQHKRAEKYNNEELSPFTDKDFPWGQFNSTLKEHQIEYQQQIDPFKQKNNFPVWLDFMGQGIDDQKVFSDIICTTLNPHSPLLHKIKNERITIIGGDIFRGTTWKKIKDIVNEKTNGKGLDLITSFPNGGMYLGKDTSQKNDYISHYILYYKILQRLFSLLAENGEIYFEVRESRQKIRESLLKEFKKVISKSVFIKTYNSDNMFSLFHLKKQGIQIIPSTREMIQRLSDVNL